MYPSGGKTVSSSVASAAIEQAQWSMVCTMYMYIITLIFMLHNYMYNVILLYLYNFVD